MSLEPRDRLREAMVVLPEDLMSAWVAVIERSGRVKTTRSDLLDRVALAFGETDTTSASRLAEALLKEAPELPEEPVQFIRVLAGSQLVELFAEPSRMLTEATVVDAAALAVRILGRAERQPVFADLPAQADSWLARRSDSVRGWPNLELAAVHSKEVGAEATEFRIDEHSWDAVQGAHNGLVDHIAHVATALNENRSDVAGVASAFNALSRGLAIVFEQQQIAWWLSSPHEPTLDWRSAYDAAQELLALTRLTPGPRAAHSLFKRRLGTGEWRGGDTVTLNITVHEPRFAPVLTALAGGKLLPVTEVATAADAAVALYDELVLNRMLGND